MNTKLILALAALGVVAFVLTQRGKNPGVGPNGQRPLGSPPPPPPPQAAPVAPTPNAQQGGGGWLQDLAAGVGVAGGLVSIWDNLGGNDWSFGGSDEANFE